MSPLRRILLRQAHAVRDQVVERLSQAQFVYPHKPVQDVLLALEPRHSRAVVNSTLAWLRHDPALAIGRLRRTELVQLARCLDRTARQNVAATVA